jgi:cyanophycin synthetase
LACAQGVFLGTLPVATQSLSPSAAAQTLLINRQTEIVVIENSIETMLNEGLAYDRCQVGVVTALTEADVLPAYHIDTPERLFNVVRTQVDVVLPDGVAVLNADCPLVHDMAELCDGEVILFATDPANHPASAAAIATHRAKGGKAVLIHDGMILMATGEQTQPLLALADLSSWGTQQKVGAGSTPGTPDTPTHERPVPLLAAIGAAWALHVPLATLRTGIETF